MSKSWSIDSWRNLPVKQMPTYPDAQALKAVEQELGSYPPLVFAGEARALKEKLGEVAEGNAFLLQAGTAPKALRNFTLTISATPSRSCCRWRLF